MTSRVDGKGWSWAHLSLLMKTNTLGLGRIVSPHDSHFVLVSVYSAVRR